MLIPWLLKRAWNGSQRVACSETRALLSSRGETMLLEDHFDFQAPNDIRLKGTRVGIETVLYDFIHRSKSPEQIAATYPSLTLEQVYATITYYLHNKEAVSTYLTEWLEHGRRMR